MMQGGILLVAAVVFPAVILVGFARPTIRARALDLLAIAPLPGLAAALLARNAPPLVFRPYGLSLSLALDDPGALLLGVAALLWSAAGLYASAYLGSAQHGVRFAACWLLTLIGSLGCFIAADLLTFYLAFALVSIPAYGLIIHDGTPAAWRAGAVTLALAIGGEVCLLLAFALMANAVPGESLAIRDAVAALPGSPRQDLVTGLLLAGFGLKAGLVPLHVWLPLAHPAAPMPASSVLSGAIIKAGIIGLMRFLPYDAAMPGWGVTLACFGFVTAFYGVLVGITQANPKAVLAYSSISQMGVVVAALGMGMAAGQSTTPWTASVYASHHVLAKGALFLCVGIAQAGGARLSTVLLPAVVLAAGFGGLPPTGGYLAKLAVKDQLGHGAVGVLSVLSAIGSTLLMLHFVRVLADGARGGAGRPIDARLLLAWLLLAAASVIVPWVVLSAADPVAAGEALGAGSLWAATWPVLLGAVLAAGLGRLGDRLPRIPPGDLVCFGERAAQALGGVGAPIAGAERALRHWPAAGTAMLLMILLMGAAMLASAP